MQLTERDGLNAEQVQSLLTARVVRPKFGAELVTPDLQFIEDISDVVTAGSITRDMRGPVHGSCRLDISRELAWGRDRVRLYAVLSDGVRQARWNLGVYLLTTPTRSHGKKPTTFSGVKGYDAISRLQRLVGDSYSVAAGMTVADAIRQIVAASGVGTPVRIDSNASAVTLPSTMTWPSMAVGSGQSPTWIRMLTDLTGAIGYRPIFANGDGELRTGLYQPDTERKAEWEFVPEDLAVGVVEPNYETTADVWGQPNRWWFYINRSAALIDGITLFRYDNLDQGPSSQLSIGLNPTQPQGLDVVDYAALVREGTRLAQTQIRVAETISAKLGTFPALWHDDIAEWVTADGKRKVRDTWWEMPLSTKPVQTKWEVIA